MSTSSESLTERATRVANGQKARRNEPAVDGALQLAAADVLRDADAWAHYALDDLDSEATRRMDEILDVLQGRAEALSSGMNPAELSLTRRLVDLLRARLLNTAAGVRAEAVLDVIRRLEQLRDRLEPLPHQSLATRLLGCDARALVTEVAHDLRSPLTSIMFLAETLRRGQSGEINDIQRRQLGIVYSAALHLSGIATDLIDLAAEDRYLTGEASARSPLSIMELFESVRAMVYPMVEEKRLDLLLVGPDQDLRLGTSVSLGRVLLNLTTNAIKFTEAGRVELIARECGPSRVEFSVRDTGRGMDDDAIQRLYEPFHRSRSRSGFHFSGSGLGLSICRRLVEIMGGTLELETAVGRGSRFHFELDMAPAKRV